MEKTLAKSLNAVNVSDMITRERAAELLREAEADLELAKQWGDKAWEYTLRQLVSDRRMRVAEFERRAVRIADAIAGFTE